MSELANESTSTPAGSHTLSDGHRYPVEPWRVREIGLDQATLGVSESLFTLSNGHIGVRGNLDEGDPAGKKVRVGSTRIVSLTRRSLLAIDYRVEPIDEPLRIAAQSELVANEPTPRRSTDPRVTAVIKNALEPVEVTAQHPNWARVAVSTRLDVGDQLRLVKFVAYGWSGRRPVPALRDQVSAALLSALDAGWDGIFREQEAAFDDFWSGADVELDGPVEIQQAVRFGIFHAHQAGARTERRAIAAKGPTGTGYEGHAFWDTESFVLPLLTATAPGAAWTRCAGGCPR